MNPSPPLQSMTVLGFMPRSEIRRQLLMGDGAMTFQPVEDDDNSATALSALAHALQVNTRDIPQ